MKNILLALCVFGLAACSGGGGGGNGTDPGQKPMGEYRTEAAEGFIGGAPWLFLSGQAKVSFSDANFLTIGLYNRVFEQPCSNFNMSDASIATRVPAVNASETVYGVGTTMETATFIYVDTDGGMMNKVATNGRIKITSITANEVTGFFVGYFDDQNYVNGAFRIPLCQ